MLLSEKLTKLLNEQINQEFYSAYLYLDFAGFFKKNNMSGFGHWYVIQAAEEIKHGMKIYDYMLDQGRCPELKAIEKPNVNVRKPMDVGKAALSHEMLITGMINKIYDIAVLEKDYRTKEFLDWFVKEQNEEEKNACDMLAVLEQIDGNRAATYFADMKMNERE